MSRASATSRKSEGFTFEQLDGAAKEKARDWWRGLANDDGWYGAVYEDAIQIFALFGFSVSAEDIQFTGFCSQGDGASFGGHYAPPETPVVTAVAEHAPKDQTLKALAEEFDLLQTTATLRWNAQWVFRVFKRSSSYCHSGCMAIEDFMLSDAGNDEFCSAAEDSFEKLCRRLADWLYSQLEAESEYLDSDEVVDEALAGDYRFDELGHII